MQARRELQQQRLLKKLTQLRRDVINSQRTSLDDDELEALSIRKLTPIDVDETAPFDSEPLFFKPLAVDDVDIFSSRINQSFRLYGLDGQQEWSRECYCYYQDDFIKKWVIRWELQCREEATDDCTQRRAEWFIDAFGRHPHTIREDETGWSRPSSEMCYCSLDRHVCGRTGDSSYNAKGVFRVSGNDKPHVAMAVYNSIDGESRTMTSEVVVALSLLMYRLRHAEFIHHHTIPVMVYSFFHDRSARLTQMHCDGSSIMLRQSRLLDHEGAEPTADAYLFVRWMASTPLGNTRYQLIQEEMAVDAEVGATPVTNVIAEDSREHGPLAV